MKQFVSQGYCLKCDICCRFPDKESPYAAGLELLPAGNGFICAHFDQKDNKCKIYTGRPLDCKLYPFVLMWDGDYRGIVLGLDHKCPHAQGPGLQDHAGYLKSTLKKIDPQHVLRFQGDIEILGKVDAKLELALNKLSICDSELFNRYAGRVEKPLASYSFAANYVWTGLMDYYWMVIGGNFCLFCKSAGSFFMPLPPLGGGNIGSAAKRCFQVMDTMNKNKKLSRIEEIKEADAPAYQKLGYNIRGKGSEYICRQRDLADLAGDKYKAKRALCNYFVKHYKFEHREFRPQDKPACLRLFEQWRSERAAGKGKGSYYEALMEDAWAAHKKAMDRYEDLGLAGMVVIVDKRISAYTFGCKLDDETFVVLFEIADLKMKGLAQFIFREFSRKAGGYKYINLMDDSGLENLRKVKLSYHPAKIERTFCAYA